MKKIIVLLVSLFLFINVKANDKIYLFYGDECPVCEITEKYLEKTKYDVIYYETWNNTENRELLEKIADKFGDQKYGVPYMVIGNQRIIGFNDNVKEQIDYLMKKDTCDLVYDTINKINKCEIGVNLDGKIKVYFFGYFTKKQVIIGLIALLFGLINGINPNITSVVIEENKKNSFIFILISSFTYLILFLIIINIISLINYNLNNIFCLIALVYSIYKLFKKNKYNLIKNNILSYSIKNTMIMFINSLNFILLFAEILYTNNISFIDLNIYSIIYIIFYMMVYLVIYLYKFTTKIKKIDYNNIYNIITSIIVIIFCIFILI